jgi:hypothetical protein
VAASRPAEVSKHADLDLGWNKRGRQPVRAKKEEVEKPDRATGRASSVPRVGLAFLQASKHVHISSVAKRREPDQHACCTIRTGSGAVNDWRVIVLSAQDHGGSLGNDDREGARMLAPTVQYATTDVGLGLP